MCLHVMPYEAKDPQNIFTIFPKCLQGFKNFFTIFLKTLVKCCRGENCKRRQNYAGSSIPHICRACNAQNANTRIYAIYHETKAKIIKAIVVSRSEARGSSSNGIETDFGGRSNEQMSMSVYILNDSKMQNDADIPLKPEMD